MNIDNVVMITGRIGQDIELRHTQAGIPVTAFSVAVNRPYQKDKDRETDWVNVVAWRTTAEFIARNFSKGSGIKVLGAIQTRKYTDKNGDNRTAFEIVAEQVGFNGEQKKTESTYSAPSANVAYSNDDFEEIAGDDELPF